MIVLGLTGSIGMGKSTTAVMLRRMRVPVYDADAAVHALLSPGGAAFAPVAAAFPGSVEEGGISRAALGRLAFAEPAVLTRLEAIIHPLIRTRQQAFLRTQRCARRRLVVLDIPLLYEGGGDKMMDAVICVTAPRLIQRARVLARPGMTKERFKTILARQMPDAQKRRRADFVIPTGLGRALTWRRLSAILRTLRQGETNHA